MSKILKSNLSNRSIQNLIKELEEYKDVIVDKNDLFIKKLAETGIPVIELNISSVQGDSNKNHNTYIKLNSYGDYSRATLVCEGRDILFIEFGSGIYYNGLVGTSLNPKGKELGYTIGSYGKGKGKQNTWGYYSDSGELVLSHGTQATMPMYKASLEIKQKTIQIAKEVFGGWFYGYSSVLRKFNIR